MPPIFDRFHRAPDTRARKHEGTGIELALVQELAQLHGGAIKKPATGQRASVSIVT
jgi:signal transduction histidine kinase